MKKNVLIRDKIWFVGVAHLIHGGQFESWVLYRSNRFLTHSLGDYGSKRLSSKFCDNFLVSYGSIEKVMNRKAFLTDCVLNVISRPTHHRMK